MNIIPFGSSVRMTLPDLIMIGTATVLMFIATFRADHIGTDHINYINMFHIIEYTGDAYFSEKGYVLLNRAVLLFSNRHFLLNGTVAAMLIIPYMLYLKKFVNVDEQVLAVLIFAYQPYFYLQSTFNIMRQCCGTGIMLLAVHDLYQKKYIRYSLLVLIASTFHRSLLLMLFFPFLFYMNWNQTRWIVVSTVALFANILQIGTRLILLFRRIGLLVRYTRYSYEASLLNFFPYVLFIYAYILFLARIYSRLWNNENERFWINTYIVSLIFLILAVQNDGLYRVYIPVALISINGAMLLLQKIKKFIPRVEFLYVGYYSCFYLGCIAYFAYVQNKNYVPFQFAFSQ